MLNYEITLKREVLREKSAGILADFNRYIREKNLTNELSNPVLILKETVGNIYRNIFKPEYDTFEKLTEANIKLDLANDVLKELN